MSLSQDELRVIYKVALVSSINIGPTFYTYLCRFGIIHHDDVIKWKHLPRYWPFVRGIHRSPVNSPHKGQWRGALIFSLICAWINGWVNNREAGDLRRHRAHYNAIVMIGHLYIGLSVVVFILCCQAEIKEVIGAHRCIYITFCFVTLLCHSMFCAW